MPTETNTNIAAIVDAVAEVCRQGDTFTLLHGPTFAGNEWAYVKECIDTGWVSSAGSYVTRFEQNLQSYTGAKHAVAVVNGTAALHIALMLGGVQRDDEVLIPSLTFVATANAVAYIGAVCHFCDVETATLGIDPLKLVEHLERIGERRDGACFNRETGRRISALVPMHTFGHPVDLETLLQICAKWNIPLIEDAAESLGSFYRGKHTGTFGRLGILSFNGNKIITTGGGGAILTDDPALAARARHLTTTAKLPHAWEFVHDEVGYNYRMPNLNAALGCAQLEQLPGFLKLKRQLVDRYRAAFANVPGVKFVTEPAGTQSNYWLNALVFDRADRPSRDALLAALNAAKLQSRPIWTPMHELPMYRDMPRMDLSTTVDLAARIVNIPSSSSLGAN